MESSKSSGAMAWVHEVDRQPMEFDMTMGDSSNGEREERVPVGATHGCHSTEETSRSPGHADNSEFHEGSFSEERSRSVFDRRTRPMSRPEVGSCFCCCHDCLTPGHGGMIPRGRLPQQVARFSSGEWSSLLEMSLQFSLQRGQSKLTTSERSC